MRGLKPCPFCGGKAIISDLKCGFGCRPTTHYIDTTIVCVKCGVALNHRQYISLDKNVIIVPPGSWSADEVWNRRVCE